MLSLLSAASGFNAPLSSRVAAPTRAAAPVMDNSWRKSFDGRGGVGGSQGGIALEMGVPEACKYFMKVTAAGLSTSDAAAYLISEKGVSKMTVAQALCTAETMDPKFGAVQGHP